MDINNDADGSIRGDINLVSGSITADGVTEEQDVAMPTAPRGKKAKKAAVSTPYRLANTCIKPNSLCRRKPPHV